MKFKMIILGIVFTTILYSGCGQNREIVDKTTNQTKTTINTTKKTTIIENDESIPENAPTLDYTISNELYEIKEKNIKINYPKIDDAKGDLNKGSINQSFKKITDIYGEIDTYSDVIINYNITKMGNDILSILSIGSGKLNGGKNITIQNSVNIDIETSNEITYNNLIKNDAESKQAVTEILDKKAKEKGFSGLEAEGIRIYFTESDIVFYYMPLDDTATEFIELVVPITELDEYLNKDFGDIPAS